jgi:hypothetical protein
MAQVKVLADLGTGEGFLVHRQHLVTVSLHGKKVRELSFSFVKAITQFMRPSHDLITPPKTPSCIVTLGT